MSFHSSSKDIHIQVDPRHQCTLLLCMVRNQRGDYIPNKIRLDDHIGNTDGWFIWGGTNFTQSASNIALELTQYGPKLCADLRMHDGGSRGRQGIMLSDKIENRDGHLHFLGP